MNAIIKKSAVLLYALVCFSAVNAQLNYLEVEYKFNILTPKGESFTFFRTLRDDGKTSLFSSKDSNSTTSRMVMKIDYGKDKGIFVNKLNSRLYQYYPILNKDYYIREDSITDKFNWSIQENIKKTILGYECKMATCVFRGRTYRAYFTESLPFFTGPWKLSGLPGTILEAVTLDGMYTFEAYRVSTNAIPQKIVNPYTGPKISFLSFVDHKKLFLKKIHDLQNKAQTQEKDEDVNYTFEDNSIELLK